VRGLTEVERGRIEVGLRSLDTFVVRLCRNLLASERGGWAPRIAEMLGCNDQTVRNVLNRFGWEGLDECLTRRSSRAHTAHAKVDEVGRERLRVLLHPSPRTLGKPTDVWTLGLVAEVSFAEGLIAERVSDDTIRQAMGRLGLRWKWVKRWISSHPSGQHLDVSARTASGV